MANKTHKTAAAETKAAAETPEARLESFAEDLGTLLGQAQNKAESWLGQRKAIAVHLTELRDTATRLLAQLGVGDTQKPASAKPNQAASPRAKRGRAKRKRTMSVEARAKIAEAQRARWAKQKKNNG